MLVCTGCDFAFKVRGWGSHIFPGTLAISTKHYAAFAVARQTCQYQLNQVILISDAEFVGKLIKIEQTVCELLANKNHTFRM